MSPSSAWRYVVRPDGSFSRTVNVDGDLDDVSDEELLRLSPAIARHVQPLRPCSRCGGDLLLQWNGPWGTGVWMELCPACDAERPAARALIRWHRDPGRDPKALPKLFEDWETETMHAHGWSRAEEQEGHVPVHPPIPPGLTPRGQG
jgi:SAM-dependent methyltransferase